MFGVGSVYYFCAVVGEVWFTAHVVVRDAVDRLRLGVAREPHVPALAGLSWRWRLRDAGLPGLFMTVLFLFEARAWSGRLAGGATGAIDAAGARCWRGWVQLPYAIPRWRSGACCACTTRRASVTHRVRHRFLHVQWQERIVPLRPLQLPLPVAQPAAALVLLPRIMARYPYVKISQHGMSLLVTSPEPGVHRDAAGAEPPHVPLWFTIAGTALPSLLYQNSGYIQWGYRFSLDYMIYFMMMLAVGNRPLTRLFKALVVVAFAINLFLAIIFDRYMQFSYDDSFFPHGNN